MVCVGSLAKLIFKTSSWGKGDCVKVNGLYGASKILYEDSAEKPSQIN